MTAPLPRILIIAGSDSGGGAGIQADLQAFHELGVYGTCAVTAVTAQNTYSVRAVHVVPAEVVAAQIDAVAAEFQIDALKTGMLANAANVAAVAERARSLRLEGVVVDPVMVATSGRRLLDADAISVVVRELLPLAFVVTPNVPEAEVLTGRSIASGEDIESALRDIYERFGPRAVIIKGGHREGNATDLVYDGQTVHVFDAERIVARDTHGSGCAYSAAITAGLACSLSLLDAVAEAKRYVTESIRLRAASVI